MLTWSAFSLHGVSCGCVQMLRMSGRTGGYANSTVRACHRRGVRVRVCVRTGVTGACVRV